MGQYYKPVLLKEDYNKSEDPIVGFIDTWDCNCGLKLMEHSYVGNHVTLQMEKELAEKHYGTRLVWAGDYADENENWKDELGDYLNTYKLCDLLEERNMPIRIKPDDYETLVPHKFVLNLDKKEWVRIPKRVKGKWAIHPLPLLCADGNDRGGGDFHKGGRGYKYVGRWAYDHIGVADEVPKGFKEIRPRFKEDR